MPAVWCPLRRLPPRPEHPLFSVGSAVRAAYVGGKRWTHKLSWTPVPNEPTMEQYEIVLGLFEREWYVVERAYRERRSGLEQAIDQAKMLLVPAPITFTEGDA